MPSTLRTILFKRGLLEKLQAATLTEGEIVLATDTGEIYSVTSSGLSLAGAVGIGITTNRPAFGILGRVYFDTTLGKLQIDTGTEWVDAFTIDIDEVIDDTVTNGVKTWSSQKIANEFINLKKGMHWQDAVSKIALEPDTTEVIGDRVLIMGGVATGDFAGKENNIAVKTGSGTWEFIEPKDTWTVRCMDGNNTKEYVYEVDDTSWHDVGSVVNMLSGTGITITGNTINFIVGKGLKVDSGDGSITVDLNASTFEFVSNTIGIKDGAITANMIGSSVIGTGLQKATAADPISLKLKATNSGLVADATGLSVDLDGVSLVFDASGKLTIGTIDGGIVE